MPMSFLPDYLGKVRSGEPFGAPKYAGMEARSPSGPVPSRLPRTEQSMSVTARRTSSPHGTWQHRGVTTPMDGQVPGIPPEELPAELPGQDSALLDVREINEWDAGHAPGAVHIPMSEIPQRLDEVPATEQLYVVCRSGGRSAKVTAYLNANGWDAVNVERGMNGWVASGRPVVCDDSNLEAQVL